MMFRVECMKVVRQLRYDKLASNYLSRLLLIGSSEPLLYGLITFYLHNKNLYIGKMILLTIITQEDIWQIRHISLSTFTNYFYD